MFCYHLAERYCYYSPVRPVNAAAAAAIIIIKGMLNFFCLCKLRLSL